MCIPVNRGWHANIRACIKKKHLKQWNKVVKKIQSWIYSWMKPRYVEDADEYEISKNLLIRFICSDVVLRAARFNRILIIDILMFLRGHVFVYENQYLYYLRKHIRHYEILHGSQHEVSAWPTFPFAYSITHVSVAESGHQYRG